MIVIKKSQTADTRSCDFTQVTKDVLLASSIQHIGDVRKGLGFFESILRRAAVVHDFDKITDIDGFHADFLTGFAKGNTGWWERHRGLNRHHLTNSDGVPDDVNLIDVLDFIADCVMAGKARTGTVYPLELPDALLKEAFLNTVALLTREVVVEKDEEVK